LAILSYLIVILSNLTSMLLLIFIFASYQMNYTILLGII